MGKMASLTFILEDIDGRNCDHIYRTSRLPGLTQTALVGWISSLSLSPSLSFLLAPLLAAVTADR